MTDPRTPYIEALRAALPGGLWVAASTPGRIISDAANVVVVFFPAQIVVYVHHVPTVVSEGPAALAARVREICAEHAAELRQDANDLDLMAVPIAAVPPPARPYRTGDVIRHIPSDEEWLVADVTSTHIGCCGWPHTLAPFSDVELVKAATDEAHLKLLREMANMSSPDPRRSYAQDQLHRMACRELLKHERIQTDPGQRPLKGTRV